MAEQDQRPVLFFDIDNCLYPSSARVHDLMCDLIGTSSQPSVHLIPSLPALIKPKTRSDKFFITHLSLSPADANTLHQTYYKQYGLAIEGLTRHHKIDALEFNRLVDDALPLDTVLAPIPALTKLLEDIDKKQVKLWLFTNAYVNHGRRVVRLLDAERFFEGMTYSDYAAINRGEKMVCKPTPEAYEKAMKEAGVRNVEDCYFVGTSALTSHPPFSRATLCHTSHKANSANQRCSSQTTPT